MVEDQPRAEAADDAPERIHYRWWEILRDHWYAVLIVVGLSLASRLAGLPPWVGTALGFALYATLGRANRWWRGRRQSRDLGVGDR